MSGNYQISLFIFRRDLRLADNTSLLAALEQSSQVIPCFIFDPNQVTNKNAYKSDFCLQFMRESLLDLQAQLAARGAKLFLFYGEPLSVIKKIHQQTSFEAIFVNSDYTPFSKQRDSILRDFSKSHNIEFKQFDDLLLNPPKRILKKDGTPYTVFTPYYNNSLHYKVRPPKRNNYTNYYKKNIVNSISIDEANFLPFANNNVAVQGGREACKKQLQQIRTLRNYEIDRNFPSKDSTTKMSAYLKFTTCSIREIYHYINKHVHNADALIRELYWRDFFTTIAHHYPSVFERCFYKKFDRVRWQYDEAKFNRWKNGETGFPIVDAGMRELNQTGYMHNRCRLITASFLVKDLHIDWRLGEKYFAQHLVDYDPAVNNGNWQWVAGTGCDAQPYFRIFNPWLQQKKFDPECLYIKHWLPELRTVDCKVIHNWAQIQNYQDHHYPAPMLNHTTEAEIAKKMYSELMA